MNNRASILAAGVALAALCLATACSQPSEGTHTHADGTTHAAHAPETPAAESGTHTHADGTTHAAHAPETPAAKAGGHSHGGEVTSLGRKMVEGIDVAAKLEGAVVGGQDAVALIDVTPAVATVRLWIGDEMEMGSMRSKAEGGPASFHGHVPVPPTLADDAQLWVEVQDAEGKRVSVAFDLPGRGKAGEGAPVDEIKADTTHSHAGQTHSH